MRRTAVPAAASLSLFLLFFLMGGTALAGPSGSQETANEVDCNEDSSTSAAGVAYVYAGTNGAEACADNTSAFPIDGSATVDAEDGYAAIDGDNSNAEPANGYARVDGTGVHCGNETNQDSSADQSGNTATDCG
ncbi:MAG TPA: hypothetical protein VNP73_05815 [Actinomycetota bacterium]|nr:hypothetical protein [Actinomycetota bacterium]